MSLLRDALAFLGVAAVLYGTTLVHPALAWIAGGVGALCFAVLWSKRAQR